MQRTELQQLDTYLIFCARSSFTYRLAGSLRPSKRGHTAVAQYALLPPLCGAVFCFSLLLNSNLRCNAKKQEAHVTTNP